MSISYDKSKLDSSLVEVHCVGERRRVQHRLSPGQYLQHGEMIHVKAPIDVIQVQYYTIADGEGYWVHDYYDWGTATAPPPEPVRLGRWARLRSWLLEPVEDVGVAALPTATALAEEGDDADL